VGLFFYNLIINDLKKIINTIPNMKKIILPLAVVSALFVSCKETTEKKEVAADSTVVATTTPDSTNATVDSIAADETDLEDQIMKTEAEHEESNQ
jgi:hypothetical protein